jgi:hypothetical protein
VEIEDDPASGSTFSRPADVSTSIDNCVGTQRLFLKAQPRPPAIRWKVVASTLVLPRSSGSAQVEGRRKSGGGRWHGVRFVTVAYLLSRLCTFVGFAATALFQSGGSLGRVPWLWDGGWYLGLVRAGYPDHVPESAGRALKSTIAFFPGFPAAVRMVSLLPGVSDPVAALVVSLASGGLATWAVFCLASRLSGAEIARRSVLLFCFFPGSVVFSMAYAEGLMVVFAAGCLLALVKRHWIMAGVLGGLACATRPNAIVLVAACAWAAVEAVRRRRDFRALAAPALAAAGMPFFLAFLWLRTGDPAAWFRTQNEGWQQKVDFGKSLVNFLALSLRDPFGSPEPLILLGGCAVAVAGLWQLARRRSLPPPAVIYTAGILGLAAVSRLDVFRPRAVLVAFPLFIALGDRLSRRATAPVVAVFAVALTVLPWYYSLPFASSSSP